MNTLVEQALSFNSGLQWDVQNDAVRQVYLTHMTPDCTMVVHRAYADANRIIILFTITGLSGGPDVNLQAIYRTTLDHAPTVQTIDLPEIGGFRTAEGVDGQAHVVIFDAAGVNNAPDQLTLRLTLSVGQITKQFEFTIPFIRGHMIDTRQVVKPILVYARHGSPYETTLMLERVVITPTETRVYLSGIRPMDVKLALDIAGKRTHFEVAREMAPGLVMCSFLTPFPLDNTDKWVLTIYTQWASVESVWRAVGETAIFHITVPKDISTRR